MATVVGIAAVLWIAFSSLDPIQSHDFFIEQRSHRMKTLTNNLLRNVSDMSENTGFEDFKNILKPFLVTRVSDTAGNAAVREFIKTKMTAFGWAVEEDSFRDTTPLGQKNFVNVMATSNPHAKRHLILACHYDSKYFDGIEFIGATDSAVPCAIMISIADELKHYIDTTSTTVKVALKFIFFDGEEAFVSWTSEDSIYGARHLATKMAETKVEIGGGVSINQLQQIDLFVLLDLIGTKDTQFCSFTSINEKFYAKLLNTEAKLKRQGLLNFDPRWKGDNQIFFKKEAYPQWPVEDDHVPFKKRGVPVLHLISYPFPQVWHTADDNESNLHYSTINSIMKIIRVFTIEYLGISIG